MSIIGVPNLKEIETWEGCFNVTCAQMKNVKKLEQFSGRNSEVISFNFDMWSTVYVRQKIYKFGRNWLSSFGDTEGWIW